MSEIKHTPGPWLHRSKNDSVWTQPPEGSAYTFGNHIFTFHDEGGPTVDDLNLMLAAPEMLDALSHAESWISNIPHGDNCFVSNHYEGDPGSRCNCGIDAVMETISYATAKARGEA